MPTPAVNEKSPETLEFKHKISQPHRRINPCFMTGKGCVYTEHIDREIERRSKLREAPKPANQENGTKQKNSEAERPISGFTIIPFKPNFLTFYSLCLSRYITGDYGEKVTLGRADSVRKTGYVICEKICKKIQESDFVIADISVANPNVFYELGLAYGSEQKIVLIAKKGSDAGAQTSSFGEQVQAYFESPPLYRYQNLDPLDQAKFPLSSYIWQQEKRKRPLECKTLLFIDESSIPTALLVHKPEPKPVAPKPAAGDPKPNQADSVPDDKDIKIDFTTHIKAALGVAIDNIVSQVEKSSDVDPVIPNIYHDWISKLKGGGDKERNDEGIKQITTSNRFQDILERVDQAFCVIIKTGKDCHPMMYFWLGYCHARGKNVIPITAISGKAAKTTGESDTISDLAFDIRALWHIIFDEDNPEQLEQALQETLYQMILNDYSEWSRKRFWDEILDKRGKVSIFTGALQNPDIGREMIGDWDLRAVSELTSYFASHQYRATIESPVYHPEGTKMKDEDYIASLKRMLKGKNCIIVASPDVNPLAEIVLGQAYGIEQRYWFNGGYHAEDEKNDATISFKEVEHKEVEHEDGEQKKKKKSLVFYREEEKSDVPPNYRWKRGFITRFIEGLPNQRIRGEFISQEKREGEEFTVHAHLAIMPNPFSPQERNFIVLLNGVSGPATFALTHVLTGGVSSEFVSYRSAAGPGAEPATPSADILEPHSESEKILQQILAKFIAKEDPADENPEHGKGIQCIIEVKVGPSIEATPTPFDWRHILHWKLFRESIKAFNVTYDRGEGQPPRTPPKSPEAQPAGAKKT